MELKEVRTLSNIDNVSIEQFTNDILIYLPCYFKVICFPINGVTIYMKRGNFGKWDKCRVFKIQYQSHNSHQHHTYIQVVSTTMEDAKQWVMKNKGYDMRGVYYPLHWSEIKGQNIYSVSK